MHVIVVQCLFSLERRIHWAVKNGKKAVFPTPFELQISLARHVGRSALITKSSTNYDMEIFLNVFFLLSFTLKWEIEKQKEKLSSEKINFHTAISMKGGDKKNIQTLFYSSNFAARLRKIAFYIIERERRWDENLNENFHTEKKMWKKNTTKRYWDASQGSSCECFIKVLSSLLLFATFKELRC